MIFDDGSTDFGGKFESAVYASQEEYFRDQLFLARMMFSQKRLDENSLSELRLAEERHKKHIDTGGTEFVIQGGFPNKPLAH
ncbi:hypothetical protein L9W77_18680 [Vibrio aestuarianus]|nr:hypothetical protein [Vibrio aestuarianus]